MNESMFVAIDDQSAALSIGGDYCHPICCFPIFCLPKPKPAAVNTADANAFADASGYNTSTTTLTQATVKSGVSSASYSGSSAKTN